MDSADVLRAVDLSGKAVVIRDATTFGEDRWMTLELQSLHTTLGVVNSRSSDGKSKAKTCVIPELVRVTELQGISWPGPRTVKPKICNFSPVCTAWLNFAHPRKGNFANRVIGWKDLASAHPHNITRKAKHSSPPTHTGTDIPASPHEAQLQNHSSMGSNPIGNNSHSPYTTHDALLTKLMKLGFESQRNLLTLTLHNLTPACPQLIP
jgi:hypothetical protein